jgi:hypothetical protein
MPDMLTNEKDQLVAVATNEPSDTRPEVAPLKIGPKRGRSGGLIFSVVYLIVWYAVLRPDAFIVLIVLGMFAVMQVAIWAMTKTGTIPGGYTFSSVGVQPQGVSKFQPKLIPWSKLRLVGLYRPNWMPLGCSKLQTIVLNFADWPDIPINLGPLSVDDRARFFRILARYVPQRLLAPEVLYMQLECLNGNEPSANGFTQIWSEEFDRRFELANHLCLPTGSVCGNGRYTVEMTLATRFGSTTYLVSDQTAKIFVLKELVIPVEAEERTKQKLLEHFDREAAILARLKHDNVVKVLDHFVENDRSYLVMDRAPGDSLRQQIRVHGAFDAKAVVQIAKQLADVLAYLHNQDPPVIHRDLTPDNVVYSPDTRTVTLVDFGAANIYHSHGTGTLIGKTGYMPPEQYKGKACPASDIYALGSTMLFLLTAMDPPGMGQMPAEAGNIDEALQKLLRSCLQFEHGDRPSADQLIERLKTISDDLGTP